MSFSNPLGIDIFSICYEIDDPNFMQQNFGPSNGLVPWDNKLSHELISATMS